MKLHFNPAITVLEKQNSCFTFLIVVLDSHPETCCTERVLEWKLCYVRTETSVIRTLCTAAFIT